MVQRSGMVDKECVKFVKCYNSTGKGMDRLTVHVTLYCRFGVVFGSNISLCHQWNLFSTAVKAHVSLMSISASIFSHQTMKKTSQAIVKASTHLDKHSTATV